MKAMKVTMHWVSSMVFVAIVAARAAHADDAVPAAQLADVLPAELVTEWLAADPAVSAARSEADAMSAEAAAALASPYEWNTTATYQRRAFERGADSHEWNVALERQVRLPGKLAADRATAAGLETAAQARYAQRRRDAARDLLSLWLDWAQAESERTALSAERKFAEENHAAVKRRVAHGDAAALEERLAAAEVDELERGVIGAETTGAMAWARLAARFPVEGLEARPLPEPLPPAAVDWAARVREASHARSLAAAEVAQAEALAVRAEAERTPDPTFGIFTGTEARGDESLVGGSVSIPFPGERRTQQVRVRLAQVERARAEHMRIERELEGNAQAALAAAQGEYARWKLAARTAARMRDNAELMHKAYTLGETDLQGLIAARRHAAAAAQTEAAARGAALRAAALLELEAGLLWPLATNGP